MLSILDQEQVKDVYYSQLLFNTVLKVFCQCNKARKWYKRYTDLNSESESPSVVSDSLWPHGLYNPWDSPGQNTGVGSLYLLQGIFPTQGLNPGLLHCRQFPLPPEPQEKFKNTGVGSLSLFQQIFPTQESNGGLLHCRWITTVLICRWHDCLCRDSQGMYLKTLRISESGEVTEYKTYIQKSTVVLL